MYHTFSSVRTQQRFIQSRRTEGDCHSSFNLLTSDILLDEVEKRLPQYTKFPSQYLNGVTAKKLNLPTMSIINSA